MSDLFPSNMGGRKPDYKPEMCEQVRNYCELGATDREIAEYLDVHVSQIYRWKNRYKEFNEAMKAGKEAADDRVERAFYNRAVGYDHDAVKIFCTKETGVVEVPFIEHHPPDVTAGIMWLKNRRPDKWRDKQEHKIDATIEVTSARDIIHQKLDALRERLEGGMARIADESGGDKVP